MKRLALVGLVLAAFWPTAASAAIPCRNRIYNDWYADGKIATSYPISCYRDALKHVSNDARIYSSLIDDIKSAMQAAVEREHHKNVPAQVGKGHGVDTSASGHSAGNGKGSGKSKGGGTSTTSHSTSNMTTTTSAIGGVSAGTGGGGGGLPTPIIILGALALLLAAVGAVGTGVRYYRRRGTPPPAA